MKIIFKSFPGHKGRPGHQGGSVPRSASSGSSSGSGGGSTPIESSSGFTTATLEKWIESRQESDDGYTYEDMQKVLEDKNTLGSLQGDDAESMISDAKKLAKKMGAKISAVRGIAGSDMVGFMATFSDGEPWRVVAEWSDAESLISQLSDMADSQGMKLIDVMPGSDTYVYALRK